MRLQKKKPAMKTLVMKKPVVLKLLSEGDTGSEEDRWSCRNNNTFDNIYEWQGYDAGCF